MANTTDTTPSRAGSKHPHTGGTTRRRGDALETALLDAAWVELRAAGYANMSMQAVADRAGTSRAVVYRRWRNKADLVIATMRRHRPLLSDDLPDTGSLREDVLAVLNRMSERMSDTGTEVIYGLLGDYLADAELFAHVRGQLLSIGTGVMATILERAAERGEARPNVSSRVARLPTDLFRHELFGRRCAPSKAVIAEIVDEVFLPLVRQSGAVVAAAQPECL